MRAESVEKPAVGLRAHVLAPDGSFEREFYGVTPVVIGRDPECTLQLPSPIVSRRHLTVSTVDRGIAVTDHSANGTCVDGEVVRGVTRAYGSNLTIQCGPFVVRLSVPDVAPATELARPILARDVPLTLRKMVREQLLEHLELERAGKERCPDDVLRARVEAALNRLSVVHELALPVGEARQQFLSMMRDEVLGLGPLEPLLRDASCSEIMVVDAATIYAERAGRLCLADARFTDDTAVRAAIERIVTPLGRRIDESSPIVDARLADGSRVHAVIPPIALRGPCITIRKFPVKHLTTKDLVALGALDSAMADLLTRAVAGKINVVISGGTGSGKTTLLNALSAAIPSDERVVTIEDAAELKLQQRHVVALEARPPTSQGSGGVSIRDLVKAALRMRPDRIVVGECRGGEALDMLQAMNTGHEGSMTTTHANSPLEAIGRLETLCLMSGVELPLSAIRRQIAASVQLIIQQLRFPDGRRRITAISEVVGIDEHGEVEQRTLFERVSDALDADGVPSGGFRRTGVVPSFWSRLPASRAGAVS